MENSDPDGKSAPTPNQTVASKFEIHLTCMEMIGHLGGHLQAVLCRNTAVPQLAVECSVLPCLCHRRRSQLEKDLFTVVGVVGDVKDKPNSPAAVPAFW